MFFHKTVSLKNGAACLIRSCTPEDAEEVCRSFALTHAETDFLLTYPDESSFTAAQEAEFLREKAEAPREAELCAVTDGRLVGTAGIEAVGSREKARHRAELGISVERAYWHLGIGRALVLACIDLAREAGYVQLELDAVADNDRALALYRSVGFTEYGRNPLGFRTRGGEWQELVYMRLEL